MSRQGFSYRWTANTIHLNWGFPAETDLTQTLRDSRRFEYSTEWVTSSAATSTIQDFVNQIVKEVCVGYASAISILRMERKQVMFLFFPRVLELFQLKIKNNKLKLKKICFQFFQTIICGVERAAVGRHRRQYYINGQILGN